MLTKSLIHSFDVIVLGAGGAGLGRRSAGRGRFEHGLHHQGVSHAQPHRRGARGASAPPWEISKRRLARWHMFDTVRGFDWLGDQDAIAYMCREAVDAVVELEHLVCPFSRTEAAKLPAAFRRTHEDYAKGDMAIGPAPRLIAPAMGILHTLYQTVPEAQGPLFIDILQLDLLMDDDGVSGVCSPGALKTDRFIASAPT